MADTPLTTRRHAAPWRVLLPFTLAVLLLHWWLLGGLAQARVDKPATGPGDDAAPVVVRLTQVAADALPRPRSLAVTTRPAPEVATLAGKAAMSAAQPAPTRVRSPTLASTSSPTPTPTTATSTSTAKTTQTTTVLSTASTPSTTTIAVLPALAAGDAGHIRPGTPVDQPQAHAATRAQATATHVPRPAEVSAAPAPTGETGPDEPAGADGAADVARLALAVPRPTGRSGGSTVSPAAPVRAAVSPPPPPTSPPPSAELVYRVRSGALAGEGKLVWRMAAGSYTLSLDARLPVIGTIFSERSAGGFDAHGLAPQRYTERRLRRSERALTMTRDGPGAGTLSFSASTARLVLPPGTQDRVSWLVQLSALFAAAAPGGPAAGSASAGADGVMRSGATLPVASVNGDLSQWQFKPGASDGGLLHLERRSANPYDTVAEVWLDPARRYWPVRVRLSEAGGDALELVLKHWRE